MNRWFQGTLAFVLTVTVISAVSGKEAKQLTDAESRRIVGEVFGTCYPIGLCASAGLTPENDGQGGMAIPSSTACVVETSCRGCDSGSIYRQCGWSWAGSCNGIITGCGQERIGQCNGFGGCVFETNDPTVEPCKSSNCT